MRRPAPARVPGGQGQVDVVAGAGGARYRGLMRCGSVWACPECAALLAVARRADLEALAVAASRLSWGLSWQTLTMPHDATDRLADTLDLVAAAWRHIRAGSRWRRLAARLGVLGTVRKVEVTHGDNGWHPHLHISYVTARPLSAVERDQLQRAVWSAWARVVIARGYRAPHRKLCPLDVVDLGDRGEGWAAYLGKMLGEEFTGVGKRSRSLAGRQPFDLLREACQCAEANRGSAAILRRDSSARLWREYEHVTRGRRQLSWSHHLRRRAGIAELTEAQQLELADSMAAQTEEVIYSLTPLEWRSLWNQPSRLAAVLHMAAEAAPAEERRRAIAFLVSGWVGALAA